MAVLLVLPGAFFYTTFYSEALFVFGVALTIWALREPSRLALAALGVVVASLDRTIGIVMVIPVAVAALRTRDARRTVGIVALSCGGVVAFALYIVASGKLKLFQSGRAGWRWRSRSG